MNDMLTNGDVLRDSSGWDLTAGAVYDPTAGSAFLGSIQLPTGGAMSQPMGVTQNRVYTVQVTGKAATGGSDTITTRIKNSDGTTVWSNVETLTTDWQTFHADVGLASGSYTFEVEATTASTVNVDGCSVAHVYKNREELAYMVYARIEQMAIEAGVDNPRDNMVGWNQELDLALLTMGATRHGIPDVRELAVEDTGPMVEQLEVFMLTKLHRHFALTKTDYSIGPRSESVSQVTGRISEVLGVATGGRPAAGKSVKTRRLKHTGGPHDG